jgi:DeoR family suf operon transcriptional repressor
MDTMGNSQQQVLRQLLERRLGATVDELGASVGLSRTAVNQHLLSLEHDGYVRRGAPRKTAGRPQQVYVLTEEGAQQFPKQYSWFSRLLIQTLRQDMGEEKSALFMYNLGVKRSAQLTPRLIGKDHGESVDEVVKIMNETGFVARAIVPASPGKAAVVECKNCVYHDLSKDYPEVCRFDIGLLSGLLGSEVVHESCMHRGGESCRFRIAPPASGSESS